MKYLLVTTFVAFLPQAFCWAYCPVKRDQIKEYEMTCDPTGNRGTLSVVLKTAMDCSHVPYTESGIPGDTYSGNHIIPGSFDYEGTCAEVLAMKTMIKDQVNENGGITVSCISPKPPLSGPCKLDKEILSIEKLDGADPVTACRKELASVKGALAANLEMRASATNMKQTMDQVIKSIDSYEVGTKAAPARP